MKTCLFLLLILFPIHAHAELRIIGVRVTKAAEAKALVAIASDDKKEQKRDLTVEEAARVLADAKGWGSSVIIGIEAHGVPLGDYLPLLQAIAANPWLDLSFAEGRKPDFINTNIRKRLGAAVPAGEKPR